MRSIELTKNIFYVGVDDRCTDLFENHLPLPAGVSYNSYLIVDEKVVLIDPVDISFIGEFLDRLTAVLGDRAIDILVVNHAEPDHSGSVAVLTQKYPDMQVVGNAKTFAPLEAFYGPIAHKVVVADGETMPIGAHTLQFFTAPMVHWPESMATYEQSTGILFSNDAFGGFGVLNGGIFDDQHDLAWYEDEMRRYYANIVGKVAAPTLKVIQRLSTLDIKMIAPSHGLVWRQRLDWVLDKYTQWSQHAGEEGVVIAYGSMHGNTARMAGIVAQGVADAGIRAVRVYDVARTDASFILSDIWRYRGVALGSNAHYGSMFPELATLTHELIQFKPQGKQYAIFGGMSWSGGGVSTLRKLADEAHWPLVCDSVEVKGAPGRPDDADRLYQLGLTLGNAIKNQ
ncbi:MAG: FprA family A-type flavoprotein [Bacteroidales bacterium]|nr:FprA family A-type flavoprotein [Bacteroidales bacterium]